MDKRVLRPRIAIEQENRKRCRRAFSTIDRIVVNKVAQTGKMSIASTQTDDCLSATNAKLTLQLIDSNNLLEQKNQKYIQMLQNFFLTKEKLTEPRPENGD